MSLQPQLRQIYDSLWQEAIGYFRAGKVQTDQHLLDRQNDRRVGLSVIARPSEAVVERVAALLRHLKRIAPGQPFYQAGELHLTILSLFSATEDYAPYLANLSGYVHAVNTVLPQTERFQVRFNGLTCIAE